MLNFSIFSKHQLNICSVSTFAAFSRRGRKQRQQQRKGKPQRKTIQRRRRCRCPINTRRGYYLCLYLETRTWTFYSERQHSEVQYVSCNMRIWKHNYARLFALRSNSSQDNNPTYFRFFYPNPVVSYIAQNLKLYCNEISLYFILHNTKHSVLRSWTIKFSVSQHKTVSPI